MCEEGEGKGLEVFGYGFLYVGKVLDCWEVDFDIWGDRVCACGVFFHGYVVEDIGMYEVENVG